MKGVARMATIIDGKAIAAQVRERIKKDTQRLLSLSGIVPGLAVILVGNDPASKIYVRNKKSISTRNRSYKRYLP